MIQLVDKPSKIAGIKNNSAGARQEDAARENLCSAPNERSPWSDLSRKRVTRQCRSQSHIMGKEAALVCLRLASDRS